MDPCLNRYRADIAYNAHMIDSEALKHNINSGVNKYYVDNFHAIQGYNGIYNVRAIEDLRRSKSIYEAAKPLEYAAIAGNWQLLRDAFQELDHEIFFECHFHLLSDKEHLDMLRHINVSHLIEMGNRDGALAAKIYELDIANKPRAARYLESFLKNKLHLNSPTIINSFEENKYSMVPIEYGRYDMVSDLSLDAIASLASTHRPLTMDAAMMYGQLVKIHPDSVFLDLIAEGVGTRGLVKVCKSLDIDLDLKRMTHILGPAGLL